MSNDRKEQINSVRKVWPVFAIIFLVGLVLWAVYDPSEKQSVSEDRPEVASDRAFKVLYVDSYHPSYPPNATMHKGVEDVLIPKGVELKYAYMDAKRNKKAEQQQIAAERVRGEVASWKPDIIIAADDSASRYLIEPYYKDASLPVVFIGVNWDAKQYGYPYSNATGQVEVEMVQQLIAKLKEFSKGKRVGLLTGNTLTDRSALGHYKNILKLTFDEVSLVDDYEQWKAEYRAMQKKVDLIILRNNAGIKDWDDVHAEMLVQRETRVPTGTVSSHLGNMVLISYAKSNYEFGEYGARTAWRILNGEAIENIPVSENTQAKVVLNMKLAKAQGIRFPVELIQNASLISADSKKVILINSYHRGFQWSDDIEDGVLQAFNIKRNPDGSLDSSTSNINLKIVRMDTKRRLSEKEIKEAAQKAKSIIDIWKPELIISCDDNAAKFLIAPYYKTSKIPVVFCGINWDAAAYGLPSENMTGMVEVTPVMETISLLKGYSKGERIGIIGADNISVRREVEYQKGVLDIEHDNIHLCGSFSEFNKAYEKLQDSVDMLLLVNPTSVQGWNDDTAKSFILNNTRIPTGATSDNDAEYALLGRVKVAEEQGWWAGNSALKILNGTDPGDIMVTTNKSSKLFLNMPIAGALNIKFPLDLIQGATLVSDQSPDAK